MDWKSIFKEVFNASDLQDDLTVYALPPSYFSEVGRLLPRFQPR